MVESNSETVEVGRSDELKCNTKRGIKREPSFSGWCDEDGVPQLRNDGLNEEDFDFMPLVQLQVLEIGDLDGEGLHSSDSRCRMENGGGSDGASSANGLGKKKEYVPFDIENGHDDKVYTNRIKDHVDYNETSRKKVNPVSVADVLKTLFFILVWYTLSTFLTLYNKNLLGDHMGKFPAPLLMNTIHFSMQAVLSKGITWFWSDRFQSSTMSWKDYFVRVVPTALSTAMDVNLSNLSLVFISVTFATMCKSAAPIFLLCFQIGVTKFEAARHHHCHFRGDTINSCKRSRL